MSRSVLLTAFSGGPQAVAVCDQDGKFVAVNAAVCQLLGRKREELIGEPFATFVHSRDRAASLAAYFRSIAAAVAGTTAPPELGRLRCVDSNGESVHATVRCTASTPDSVGTQFGLVHLLDISWQHEVENELAEEGQQPNQDFRPSNTGIALVGPDGFVLQANHELAELLGYIDGELTGRNVSELLHREEQHAMASTLAQVFDGTLRVDDAVQRFRHRDGSVVFARRITAAVRDADQHARYLLIQVDNVSDAHAELEGGAFADPLTGLCSREDLAAELSAPGGARALVVIEVRNISLLNRSLGRARADAVLVELTRRIRAVCRHDDVVARLGAAQFAVLVRGHSGRGEGVAQRMAAALEPAVQVGTGEVRVLAAISSAADPTGEQGLEDLLRQLRPATHSSPTRRPSPTPTASELPAPPQLDAARRLALESELVKALEAGDVTVVYQPVISLHSGLTTSLEALARWTHPDLGAVSPAEFIPVAEHIGLMGRLTRGVLSDACRDLARWRTAHPELPLSVAVNLSGSTLADPGLPALVTGQLARSDLPADALVLEFTETALMIAGAGARINAETLRQFGVQLGIDDFDAERSSLDSLAQIPATIVKLDRSLLADSAHDHADSHVLRSAIALASRLSLTLIAEGVETERQLELLRRLGCAHAQGFHLARPQSADDIDLLLAQPHTG